MSISTLQSQRGPSLPSVSDPVQQRAAVRARLWPPAGLWVGSAHTAVASASFMPGMAALDCYGCASSAAANLAEFYWRFNRRFDLPTMLC